MVHSLRLFDMDLWFDEVAILFQLEYDFAGIWDFCKSENFPPFYPWIAKLWKITFGSDLGIRYSSVLIGSLIPLAFYALGREVGNRRFAVLVAITGIFSGPILYFSQIIRMYGLFILLASLSYLFFIKALRTDHWKYWFLTALVNLLAFYTFLFAVFFIAAEFVIVVWLRRLEFRRYFRPLLAHLPSFLLILLWITTFFTRYRVHGSYLTPSPPIQEFYESWVYFGTGVNFGNWPIAFVINLPILIGFIFGCWRSLTKGITSVFVWLFILSVLFVLSTSLVGAGFFWRRYMLFLLPIYLLIAIYGWYCLSNNRVRNLGLSGVFLALILGTAFYYSNYTEAHDLFRNRWHTIERIDGHSMSKGAQDITELFREGDVIVHYSTPSVRSFTFFPFIYYHNRKYSEHLLAEDGVADHAGVQYLKPGDTIARYADLDPEPFGIFIVTLSDAAVFTADILESEMVLSKPLKGMTFLNEIFAAEFKPEKTITHGNISIIYFAKADVNTTTKYNTHEMGN
ncbi:glycosyltransferase family 39 protein [bacterium]|nr:glycosyltransferase family 39 protein [bacterium]